MAPREPYKVHSLNKHIEETKKGLSAEAQSKSRSIQRPAVATAKKEPASIFANNSESSDSSDDSSGDEQLNEVIPTAGRPATNKTTKSAASSAVKGRGSKPEEIADSDVERSAAAKKSPAAPAKKATLSSSSPTSSEEEETSSETSSESESEDRKKPRAKANGVKAKPAVAALIKDEASSGSSEEESSSEEEEDSDDEEESESSDDKKTQKPPAKPPAAAATKKATAPTATTSTAKKDAAKKITPTSKKQSSSSSDEESSEEESSEAPAKVAKPRPKVLSEPKVVESASSESEGSDNEGNNIRVDESMHMSDREGDHQVTAAMPNSLGSDFVLRKGGDGANGQDVAKILNEANVQGKQLWYFTVPRNVPVSVVQTLEIPMDRAQSGDRIFSHDGQDFGISFDSIAPKTSIQILIPSGTSSEYRATPRPIDQAVHVKRITQLGGAASSTAGPSPSRAPRPQPQGLRARYQPFGVNSPMGNIGEDAAAEEAAKDVDMAEASAAAAPTATPVSKAAVNGKKKPQQKQPSAAEAKTPDAGRRGKRKLTGSEEDAVAAAEQLKGEIQSAAKKQKKQQGRVGSPDLGSEPPSTVKAQQTAIAPPTIPQSTYSFAALDSAAKAVPTPPPKSASSAAAVTETAKKSAKKVKVETPQAVSSQAPTTGRHKQTPIPLPERRSTVPLPVMLSSSSKQAREASAPATATAAPVTPSQNKGKRSTKKGKDAEPETIPSSQQEPPPSTQPVEKAKKTPAKGKAQPV